MIIGLTGYAQVGKDTAAEGVSDFRRVAFADALKEDLQGFIMDHYGIDVFTATGPQKELIRPLLVAHGACQRKRDPMYWINRLAAKINSLQMIGLEDFVITDVRYLNELEWIDERGGQTLLVARPGSGPANEEERESVSRIIASDAYYALLDNSSTVEQLHKLVAGVVKQLRGRV